MGTRAAILVFGFSEHGIRNRDGFAAVRLYQHWDGDPSTVLGELAAAARLANGFVREHAVGLHAGIVADAALDGCQVLADALEDAGCPDGAVVGAVRALSLSV